MAGQISPLLSAKDHASFDSAARKQERRECEVRDQKRELDRIEDRQKQEEREDDDLMFLLWLASAEYRRALASLASDIDAAVQATRIAHDQATAEAEVAHESLEEIRRNALVIGDGRRVYFTRDGHRLYTEGSGEITDQLLMEEAHRLRLAAPHAVSYETYAVAEHQFTGAVSRVQHLAETLHHLDELGGRVKLGRLTPEELATARRELAAVVESLPDDARQEYDRLRESRKPAAHLAYRDARAEFQSAPGLGAKFAEVTSNRPEAAPAPDEAGEPPTYKSAPDF